MHRIAIVGTGFVADLYMNSLKTFPEVRVIKVYDTNKARLAEFSAYWNVPAARDIDEVLDPGPGSAQLILNLTNPGVALRSKSSMPSGRKTCLF